MLDEDLRILQKKINKLYNKGCFKDKYIVLFGAAAITKILRNCLFACGVGIDAVIDNDSKKIGKNCIGLTVQKPEDLLQDGTGNMAVVFFSVFHKDMEFQLKKLGLQNHQILDVSFKEFFSDESLRFMIKYSFYILEGNKYYKQIRKKYSCDKIFVCPYTGTGDVYLAGLNLKQYLKLKNIEEYVFIVVNQACRKVAQIFKIKNIEVMPSKAVGRLIGARLFMEDLESLIILNDSWSAVYTNPIQWLRGHKGLNFSDMFRYFVFDFPDEAPYEFPEDDANKQEMLRFFKTNNLIPKKTIVLSPYSNTLFEVPKQIWEEIADQFAKKGFSVCTNSCGAQEPPVKGTTPVFFPLTQAKSFLDMAGYFIGVRSGLCDVICKSECKKVIFYEKDGYFYQSSTFEYFSLKGMGLTQEVLELEYNYSDSDLDIIKNVQEYFIH